MFDEQDRKETDHIGSFAGPISGREFTPDGMTLFLAGMSYARKGGTLSEFKRIIARLLVEASLNDDAGTIAPLSERTAGLVFPASSPQANGSDQSDTVQPRRSCDVTPVRPPLNLMTEGVLKAKLKLAESVLDTFKVRDGRMIGDVRYGELERLEKADKVEAAVFAAIRKRGSAPHDAKIRDIIKPKVLETIIRKAQA